MTPREHISVAAPATVANLTVGFDCLGLALERPLERLDLRRTDTPGVSIAAVHGCDGLPMDPARNVSGKAAQSVLQTLGVPWGVELTIHKAVLPGSGIGSSAASAASAAFGVAALAGAELKPHELLPLALDGEQIASGARHADNVAPVRRTHRPAELLLHNLVDADEINAFINHAGKACQVREQYAVH